MVQCMQISFTNKQSVCFNPPPVVSALGN